jgi:hypothetical protein
MSFAATRLQAGAAINAMLTCHELVEHLQKSVGIAWWPDALLQEIFWQSSFICIYTLGKLSPLRCALYQESV